MSIDSQIKEMTALAKRDSLGIKEIRKESHSAKQSGMRPVFNRLLEDIQHGDFTGILTWAPDRLSRNAGDLGRVVDLIDQTKLVEIRTFSQTFTNNPNEKFLLMILCSQAKLENDNKSINVKRGIRAKCEMGWRPGIAPLGYFNRSFGGVRDVITDPERAPIIKEIFRRVAEEGQSGRTIKRWLDKTGFTTRNKKKLALSQLYIMLKNPFYYGEFEYPLNSGTIYKGKQEPLITKETFDIVQQKLIVPEKPKWGSKPFAFKGLFKCACCGANIVGEEKLRKRKWGPPNQHVYYHCSRQVNYDCPEPYVPEQDLIKDLVRYIEFLEKSSPQAINVTAQQRRDMNQYRRLQEEILIRQNIRPQERELTFTEYAEHTLKNGDMVKKKQVVQSLKKQLYLHDKRICTATI